MYFRVTFPEYLDLNRFIGPPADNIETSSSPAEEDTSTCDSGAVMDDETQTEVQPFNKDDAPDSDEGIDISGISQLQENNEKVEELLKKGPFVYELFSVMIHSGSASGGHYYAYIKDVTTNNWYCFNDQQVYQITSSDIVKMYGGESHKGGYYSSYSSFSTNAYMLMYRRKCNTNVQPMMKADFPQHINVSRIKI